MLSNGALGTNALGIMCNALVCLAVWLCSSACSTTDKILAILFPFTAFVAAGFEHSVANMYFITVGLFIKGYAGAEFWNVIEKMAADYPSLTWGAFFIQNLLPVIIGNIIDGSGFVRLVYWFIYLLPQKVAEVSKGMPAKLLVVDDDPDFVLVTSKILSREGYEITSSSSMKQDMEAMRTSVPDLVLLDEMMGDPLEGVNLARQMDSDPTLTRISVIMISSIDQSEYAKLLPNDLRISIETWISKPVEPEHLVKIVKRYLK